MKQTEVLKKIGGIIKELQEQYEYFEETEGELNDLEIELFTANANFLTDHIEILRKLNFQNRIPRKPVEKPENIATEKFFEPVVQQVRPPFAPAEPKPPVEAVKPIEIEAPAAIKPDQPVPHIDLSTDSERDSYSFIREEPETIRHELILDDSVNWDEEDEDLPLADEVFETEVEVETPEVVEATAEQIEEEEVKPVVIPVEELKPAPPEKPAITKDEIKSVIIQPVAEARPVVAEKEVLTINQKIQSQLADKAVSHTEQLSIKPISDIKMAITLNDKLLFIKDLFNGYSLAYSEAIEILNRFKTIDEANRFLNANYVNKNNWEGKPETTEKFYALLKRRYA